MPPAMAPAEELFFPAGAGTGTAGGGAVGVGAGGGDAGACPNVTPLTASPAVEPGQGVLIAISDD